MNPGEFDRRIELQKATKTQQENNELYSSWAEHGKRWAKVEFVSENEVLEDEALSVYSQAKFTIRYERINETDYRVKYDNKMYNINSIVPVEGRKSYIELHCESRSTTNFRT